MSTENVQSSDRLDEQSGQGENQLYIIKRGTIKLASADFSGSPPTNQNYAVIKRYSANTTTEPLFLSFDVYHYAGISLPEEVPVQLDDAILKCPYSYSQQRAVCWFGYEDTAGPGFELRLWIDYTAPGTSGSPFASDTDQLFYYMIYSQAPIPGGVIAGEEIP